MFSTPGAGLMFEADRRRRLGDGHGSKRASGARKRKGRKRQERQATGIGETPYLLSSS